MTPSTTADDPWDQRLARALVAPLAATAVHPNHLTAASLLLGLTAATLFAAGGTAHAGLAATAYMLAVFADHADGELARMTGKCSSFGHRFDYIAGGINYTALFTGIGLGLTYELDALWPLLLGCTAGFSNPLILWMRMDLDQACGREAVRHPRFSGFEIEDFIYFIGPLVWFGGLLWFFIPFGLGTLGYLAWTVLQYRRWRPGARWQ